MPRVCSICTHPQRDAIDRCLEQAAGPRRQELMAERRQLREAIEIERRARRRAAWRKET